MNQTRIVLIAAGIIAVFAGGFAAATYLSSSAGKTTSAAPVVAAAPQNRVAAGSDKPPQSAWKQYQSYDKMHDSHYEVAALRALTPLNLDFPYEGATATLVVGRTPGERISSIALVVDKGQFDCRGDACSVSIKFDDSKVESQVVSRYTDDDERLYFYRSDELAERIRNAHHLTIEAHFFRQGFRQIEFDVTGFPLVRVEEPVANTKAVEVKPHGSGKYQLLVGAFSSEERTKHWLAKIEATGVPAFVETRDLAIGRRFLLRAGPFDDRDAAEAAEKRLGAIGLTPKVVKAEDVLRELLPGRATSGDPNTGKRVYQEVCAMCHAAGVAGAPKFGDKADWAPRLSAGMDTIHSIALQGKGAMPPKGTYAGPDADVIAATDYMVSAVK